MKKNPFNVSDRNFGYKEEVISESEKRIWEPLKNHWEQWSGGWKSLNGNGWMTPKPLKNHCVQWSVSKKVVNGDGQRVAKPSKIHWCQWFSQKKNHPIPSLPKNEHCSPLTRMDIFKLSTVLKYSGNGAEFRWVLSPEFCRTALHGGHMLPCASLFCQDKKLLKVKVSRSCNALFLYDSWCLRSYLCHSALPNNIRHILLNAYCSQPPSTLPCRH